MDYSKIDTFWHSRENIEDPRVASNLRDDGRLFYDVQIVKKYHKNGGDLLDLGCGTGTSFIDLLPQCNRIVGVDKFKGLIDKCPIHENIEVIQSDLKTFTTNRIFDTVLLLGVINYFSKEDENNIYNNINNWLTKDGVLIVKNQCGQENEVIIDNWSKELETNYHARYPYYIEQKLLLENFFSVTIVDIYPPELNRWTNTHFYAFICKKKP